MLFWKCAVMREWEGKFGGASSCFGEVGWGWDGGMCGQVPLSAGGLQASAGVIGACCALSGGAYLAGHVGREGGRNGRNT